MKKRVFLFTILLTAFTTMGMAQNYSTGAGFRLGSFSGITVKHFISGTNALEGIASFRWGGFAITGLYEWQKPIRGARNLDYFLGLGGHIGFWGDEYYWHDDGHPGSYTIIGVDFIAGLEYTFPGVPFNVGLDWKPAFNLIGDTHWWGDGLAISIRYTF
ncbi:MAG: hypothetical protein IPH20_18300 [Bacteroidales bacterium]|nr:hypothetical protein [Bacteroidales bacterium]